MHVIERTPCLRTHSAYRLKEKFLQKNRLKTLREQNQNTSATKEVSYFIKIMLSFDYFYAKRFSKRRDISANTIREKDEIQI
jgi:hypothetical protein